MNKIRIWLIKRLLKREEKNIISFALNEQKTLLDKYENVVKYQSIINDLGEYKSLFNLKKIFENGEH